MAFGLAGLLNKAAGGRLFKEAPKGDKELLASGVKARAKIVSYENHWTANRSPRWGGCQVALEVHPEGGELYAWPVAGGTAFIRVRPNPWHWATKEPLLSDIPVLIDPTDPSRLEIDWDQLEEEGNLAHSEQMERRRAASGLGDR